MHIKPLTAAHAAPYRALMLHAYAHEADAFTSTAQERESLPLAWWQQRLADPDGLHTVHGALDGTTLAGTVALEYSVRHKTRHKAQLVAMVVQSAYRGQGIGRALVQAALAGARARGGIAVVTLSVTEGNHAAIGLYQGCGFRAYGTEPRAVRTPHGDLAKVLMQCELDR